MYNKYTKDDIKVICEYGKTLVQYYKQGYNYYKRIDKNIILLIKKNFDSNYTFSAIKWTTELYKRIDGVYYDEIFNLQCYYDGPRHMYVNQHEEGYLFYPDLEAMGEIFKVIMRFCKEMGMDM